MTSEIGAPQDYVTNKESDTFPDSYDLRVPGAARPSAAAGYERVANNQLHASPKAPAEENKGEADVQMRSASTSKASKPAKDYMPIKYLN